MSAPTNTSRGDLINALMDVQQTCNKALGFLAMFPEESLTEHMTSVRDFAQHILDIIHGTVTVTEHPALGIPPT